MTIHGCYRSRATRPIWLALEAGVAFRQVPVIQAYRLADPDAPDAPLHTRSPAFLAVNPNGHIPTLEDEGLVLHESLAQVLYLAKRYGGDLGPRDVAEDAQMTMWALWVATEVEEPALDILYNRVERPPGQRDAAKAAAAVAALRAPFAVLDRALAAGGGHPVGGRFTAADVCLAEVLRYAQPAPELFAPHPALAAWIAACQSRPAFQAMMAARNAEPA
nr:glutathione S-transferase family protein [Paracraurococcus ruber]